ncbi:restriction endonuclease subunit S [Streptomyces sp. NPDC056323]|uniref:restriction endonuclease subunit S n=1 Tax=Streptomyces sp. NPDC056323 TaxID=3345784 RepID=UPI0035DD0DA0
MSNSRAAIPPTWEVTRLDRVATVNARIGWKALTAAEYRPDGYAFLATPNIKGVEIDFENVNYISDFRYHESPELQLREGDVLLTKDGFTLGTVNVITKLPRPATVNGSIAVLRPFGIHPAFLRYAIASTAIQQHMWAAKNGMDVLHLFQRDIKKIPLPLPPIEEQHRIVEFLDAETARIDRLSQARESQSTLLRLLLDQLIDGAMTGESETLRKLGVTPDRSDWGNGKTSRLCEVIPGYAFPSGGFLQGPGTRLLRGINVSVDKTSWQDLASWDEERTPTPERFHLRTGDLVLGMDRPWISNGMRVTFINERDLPALLLQRVACLRPKTAGIDMRYMYWNLRSSHFRKSVESELTGVSVPHLSGEQIGSYSFALPPLTSQKAISDQLAVHSTRIHELRSIMSRQTALLTERRQALITAAVTGQFDVSTASGRNVTDGVQA